MVSTAQPTAGAAGSVSVWKAAKFWRSCRRRRSAHRLRRTVPCFRSRDGGATWSEVDSFTQAFGADTWGLPAIAGWPVGARAHSIVVDAHDPVRCLVGIEVGGVVSNADDGSSWKTTLPGGVPDIHYVVDDPERSERLYCATGFGRIGKLAEAPEKERIAGMFASDDGGQSWRYIWEGMLHRYTRPLCIDPPPPYALTVGMAPSARPYITYRIEGGAHGQIYQSADGAHALATERLEPETLELLIGQVRNNGCVLSLLCEYALSLPSSFGARLARREGARANIPALRYAIGLQPDVQGRSR
jgi:hypothetical protein